MAARGEERRFIVRTLSANLRIHAMRTTILAALARAYALASGPQDDESLALAETRAKRAYARHPNWQGLVDALRATGIEGLDDVSLALGTYPA